VKVGAEEGAVVMVSPKVPLGVPPVPVAVKLIVFKTAVGAPTGIVPEITPVDELRVNPNEIRIEVEVVLYVIVPERPEDVIVYE